MGTTARCVLIEDLCFRKSSGPVLVISRGSVSIAPIGLWRKIVVIEVQKSLTDLLQPRPNSLDRVPIRRRRSTMKKILLAACALVLTIATAHAQPPPPPPRMGPPPPPQEVIPAIPATHPNWAWRGGYYRWRGERYVWVPGSYIAPPHAGYRWYPGHWRQTRHGWVWVEGRWR